MKYDGTVSYIDTELPPAVSKTNCVVTVGNDSWFIPYGIYENDYGTVLKLSGDKPEYHQVLAKGKGQFYSGASDNETAFSFPLGYSGTQYCLYIKDNKPELIPFESVEKAHMGTVYCNGSYYSMPRGDQPGYNDLVCYNGEYFTYYYIPVNPEITRKFTDLIAIGNKLYSLPYGEQPGLNEAVEFDTVTGEVLLHKLNIPDFAKKYNSMVRLGNKIIGMPYGDEFTQDSNYGVVFDTVTKDSKSIDIGISHGGKYRYRTGIEYKGFAWFFPGGTPQCPIFVINESGLIFRVYHFENQMFGRPVIYKDKIHVLSYDTVKETHHMYIFNDRFESEVIDL
jgi:hypothetical protein